MRTIIMAGGKGTRISSISSAIPKPMIKVCGKPILEHQIECLKRNSLIDIILVVGHLNENIKEYFGDGNRFGCSISYYTEVEPLGTAGALFKIGGLKEDFVLINGDIIFDINFLKFINFHKINNALISLAVHPNNHPFDSTLIVCNKKNQIISLLNKDEERTYYRNLVSSGINILSSELLNILYFNKEKINFDQDILESTIHTGRVFGYQTPEYIKDMGTPERYTQVSQDFENNVISNRNLKFKQKCIFLDRDGTINELNGFITKPEDFKLINGVAESIKTINDMGFLVIVITNQPIIARGDIDIETLDLIHMKLETELGNKGAFIDAIYYCPHHTDKGFEGERKEYKIDCECRKPKPGMILKAARIFNIDLKQSYMVGDNMCDVIAGISAGCNPVFLTNNKPFALLENISNLKIYKDLKEFINSFI